MKKQFPTNLFESNLAPEISTEENGMIIEEVYKMLDNRLLERALHRTQNLHTAEWNMNVVRKSLHLLSYRAIQFQELYNTRIAYQAFEQFDMMGMLLNQHVILNTLRMCNRNIAPMKLANRIKHMKDNFEEKGRIQLHEFLDLVLWCEKYEDFTLDKIEYSEGKDTKDMFKLVNFEKLLSHHDQRLAVKLNDEYLKEEWDFGFEKFSSKKMFKEPPIVCAEERIQQARQNKIAYRDLKSEVSKSRKMVYKARAGYVRERPLTAPDLSIYLQQDVKREEEISEEKLINVMQQRVRRASRIFDRPASSVRSMSAKSTESRFEFNIPSSRSNPLTPRVVSEEDQEEAQKKIRELTFHIETLGSKCQINKEVLQQYYIPNHKDNSDTVTEEGSVEISVKSSPRIPKSSKEEIIQNLAYPKPLLPPSHARICDARFRGWSDVSKKKGSHFILAEHSFENSYKGLLNKKQMKRTNSVVKHIHGDFLYRHTKKNDLTQPQPSNKTTKRPLTAPSSRDSVVVENQEEITDVSPTDSNKTVDTGYGSGEEKLENEVYDKAEIEIEEPKPLMAWKSETNLLDERLFLNLENMNKKETTKQDKRRNTYAEGEIQTKNVITKETKKQEARRNTFAEGENLTKKSKSSAKEKRQNENSLMVEAMKNFNEVFENDVPIPQMEHAQPKMVNVGGIGTISLLESITEAKSLEDLYDRDVPDDYQGFHDNGQEMVTDISNDSGHEGKENEQNINFIDNNKVAVKTKKKLKVRKAISDQFFGNSLVLEKLAKEKERRMKKRNGSQSQATKTMKKYEKLEKNLKKQDMSSKQEKASSQSRKVDKNNAITNAENKSSDKVNENENFGNFVKKKVKCEKSESSRAKTSLGQIEGLEASDIHFENFDDLRPQTTSTCGNYERLVKRVSGQISNELTNRLLTTKS